MAIRHILKQASPHLHSLGVYLRGLGIGKVAERRACLRDRRGASSAELAIALSTGTLLMYGVMEAAWQVGTAAALDNAALKASRFGVVGLNTPVGVTGAPSCRSAAIPWIASAASGGFLKTNRMTVTTRSFSGFSGVSTSSDAGTGVAGAGSGGQVARYVLTYRQPYLVGGLVRLVTGATEMTYQATIIVKNEPFDNEVC